MREGKLAFMMERRDIESREAEEIAKNLTAAFDRFCAKTTAH